MSAWNFRSPANKWNWQHNRTSAGGKGFGFGPPAQVHNSPPMENQCTNWSETDKEFLRIRWHEMNDHQLAEALGRSCSSIVNKRKVMRLYRPPCSPNAWRPDEDTFIEEHYQSMDDDEIADRLGRSVRAVSIHRGHLSLHRVIDHQSPHMRWSEGRVLKTAAEYADSLGPVPKYELVGLLQLRIQEATTCLMSLHANARIGKEWTRVAEKMGEKLQAMIRDLREAQASVYESMAMQSESA